MAPEDKDQSNNKETTLVKKTRLPKFLLELNEQDILIVCSMLIASIFLLDISLAIGLVVSILYVIPVLICIWSPRRRTIFLVAAVSSILTLVAVPLKPPGEILFPLFNRPESLVALWTVAVLVDHFITERKRAEMALQSSQQMLQLVLDNVPDRVFWKDRELNFLGANRTAARDAGLSDPKEIIGKNDHELAWRESAACYQRDDRQVIESGRPKINFEEIQVQSDGSTRWLQTSKVPLRDPDGNIFGVLGVYEDITERKEMEEDLKRSNAELQQFAYVASHDLQEPLRMVTAYLTLLDKRYKGQLDEKARQYMQFAIDGGLRAKDLVQDLLAFSRVDMHVSPTQLTSMEAVLDKTLDNLSVRIKELNASVSHDPLPTILADELQMVQVMQNLISNAIKFHGAERPIVHISCKDGGQEWIFSIHDNGIGIDPRYKEKIFILFQRLHSTQEYEGTGIGLAISKKIVERHGGKIWFESLPGRGTTFYFTIPKELRR